jgi:hypothetical protein
VWKDKRKRTKALDAFHPETKQRVDVRSLVVAAQQMHIFGVFNLQEERREESSTCAQQVKLN